MGCGNLMNASLLSLRNSRLSSLPKVKILHWSCSLYTLDSVGEESACSAGDTGEVGSIHGLGRSSGGGNSNCILAWKIPWTEEPGELQSIRSQRVRNNWATRKKKKGSLLQTQEKNTLIGYLMFSSALFNITEAGRSIFIFS